MNRTRAFREFGGAMVANAGLRLVDLGARIAGHDVIVVAYGGGRGLDDAARFLLDHDQQPLDYDDRDERRRW